ncbi:YmaF family protein [Anaerosporobacter sp.]|uniref:YmaF family protein n=1 Tax=Anaerosporobacter sp. TaxID=1872529 RepID=UPI00286F3628|nr:YmaF family protein [Anaerosporobacter sp.]
MSVDCFHEDRDYRERQRCEKEQTHVHEVLGSVRLAELDEDPHNHRFAGVTGEVIFVPGGHIHKFETKTDFYEDHFHPICVKTGLNVRVGKGDDTRHVHFIDSQTRVVDNHFHEFIAATLIENPIGD